MSNPKGNYKQQPKMEKLCKDCGCKINTTNTYKRKKGIDNRCIPCRIANNKKRQKYNYVCLKEKNENYDRSNDRKFKRYMRQNPQYFKDVFNVPATPENINRVANQLF